jgi:hypothetical protein
LLINPEHTLAHSCSCSCSDSTSRQSCRYRQVISKLQACNAAARKELDWQGQQDALTEARRLVAHHPEVIRSQLHEFVLAAAPAIDQLRSTTAKSSLLLFQELFVALGRGFDREVEEVVPLLLKKAAEVSTAGAWRGQGGSCPGFLVSVPACGCMELVRAGGEVVSEHSGRSWSYRHLRGR